MRALRLALPLALVAAVLATAVADAHHGSRKKSMWGPVAVDGRSTFPIYHELGVGIYQTSISWDLVAPTQPANPTDPDDPAYRWPAELDEAIREADRYGIRVMLQVFGSPAWANGGHERTWVPTHPKELGQFAAAAARRYPRVKHWMIWGEPTRSPNFFPLNPETPGEPLTADEALAPRHYARMLDASYLALKGVRRSNLVIGGNSFTTGEISPRNWIINMRLPNGKRPRMDLYGHNPFSIRRPDLRQPLVRPGLGWADFSDLDTLGRWLDRFGYRDAGGKRLRIFISEWSLPTDHANHELPFWVTREVQARYLRMALRIVRKTPRLYTLGWMALYDEQPRPKGDQVNRGLLDIKGRRKPAFRVFKQG